MRVDSTTLARWSKYADLLVRDYGKTLADVTEPSCAWLLAYKLDIPREAYREGCNDRHIETALRRIFPNAWDKS
jgi:hypothetical protein